MEIGVGLGLGLVVVGVGAGLVFTPCQESEGPLRAWLRLDGRVLT